MKTAAVHIARVRGKEQGTRYLERMGETQRAYSSTYMTWFFEEKECNTIGSSSKSQRVLSVDKGAEMLFYPREKQNMQTNDLCSTLAAGLATCLILELEDPRKANSDYLSAKGGKYS